MKILAFDTTTEACSVAVLIDDAVVEDFRIAPQQHGHLLLSMIENLRQAQGLQLSDVDCFACSHGPGSFTGIRIALNVLQALAVAHQQPVVCVSSLHAMAWEAPQYAEQKTILVANDARMGELYLGCYHREQGAVIADGLVKPDALPELAASSLVGIGSAWPMYHAALTRHYGEKLSGIEKIFTPRASAIARLAAQSYQDGKAKNCRDIIPHYIRNNVTS